MNPESFLQQRLVCVAVIDKVDDAVPLAEALLAGGLNCIEVTFRTAGAAESIARIRKALPNAVVGAGTLLTPDNVKAAVDAGAQFGVAPGLSEAVACTAQEKIPVVSRRHHALGNHAGVGTGLETFEIFSGGNLRRRQCAKSARRAVRSHGREIYSDRRHHGSDAAELSRGATSRGHRRFVVAEKIGNKSPRSRRKR